MLKEFKEFAMRGNVVDMAVGIIIGAAFGTIVNSLVADVIMPPIGLLLGNIDFSNLFVVLREGAKAPAPYESRVNGRAASCVLGVCVDREPRTQSVLILGVELRTGACSQTRRETEF